MTNSNFIQKFHELETGLVFEKILELDYAKICYCKFYDSEYWNYAYIEAPLDAPHLELLEEEFVRLERKSTLYFENDPKFSDFLFFLENHYYEKKYEESWLFFEKEITDTATFSQVKKVQTEEELKKFLLLFDNCYQKEDPQNPYGELGEYLVGVERDWLNHHSSDRVEYFIVYKDEEPVAVSTLINHEELGYIANVGSLREVRGEGFGKLATLYCVYISQQNGNKCHFLSTEVGSYPEEFYQRIGFKKKFTTLGYTKVIDHV